MIFFFLVLKCLAILLENDTGKIHTHMQRGFSPANKCNLNS